MNQIKDFKKYNYLLFDLDNTLLDFTKSSHIAFNKLMKYFEIENESINLYDSYQAINAKYWHYFEKQKITANQLNAGRFKEFLKVMELNFNEHELAEKYLDFLVEHSSWIAGAESLLKQYSTTHELAIITNGLSKAQHLRLEKHDMKKYFKHILISEELGCSKPNSFFFEKAHQIIDEPNKNEVLVIGDNPNSDIKGGNNFGFSTCWYDYKQNKKQRARADYKVTDWNEFLNLKDA